MRSAEPLARAAAGAPIWRRALAAALLAALAGCAGLGGGAAPPPAAAPAPATPADKPPLVPLLPVAVLDSYDAALRALHEGRLAEAEQGFLALTRSHPDLGGPHANLGIVYRRADKLGQAVSELERAVQCNPQQPVFWNQLGIAYRQQGQFAKAREAYEKSMALDPSYPAPILNLGMLFDLYLWDSNRAVELYDRYLALTPGGDAKVAKWLADLKNRNRQADAAKRKEKE